MTKYMQAKLLISAEKLSQCPNYTLPEYPLLGRSNVGKSSFINALANQKKLGIDPVIELKNLVELPK